MRHGIKVAGLSIPLIGSLGQTPPLAPPVNRSGRSLRNGLSGKMAAPRRPRRPFGPRKELDEDEFKNVFWVSALGERPSTMPVRLNVRTETR
jgi:hypothetical protein